MRIHLLAAILLSLLSAGPNRDRPDPDHPLRFTPFNAPFSQTIETQVMGINNLGTLVGVYESSSLDHHAFLRRGNNYFNIDVTIPGANETVPYGINLEGEIVGRYQLSGRYHGFIRSGNHITTIDYPDPNNFGTVLTAINLEGEVIGIYSNLTASEGFLYQNNHFTPISYPGANITYVSGINDFGTVVGYYVGTSDLGHPFLYRAGQYTRFTIPEANVFAAYPTAINDRGQIAGYFTDPNGQHGFILDTDQHLTIVDAPASQNPNSITILRGLNNFDQAVGIYGFPGTSFTAVPTRPWF